MSKKKLLFLFVLLSFGISLDAQDSIQVYLNVKHSTEGVSEFDRSKYIVIHEDIVGNERESQTHQKALLEEYDVYYGRNNGSIVWEWNNTKADASKPGWPDLNYMQTRANSAISDYKNNSFVHQFEHRYENMMIGGQEHMFPHGQATSKHGLVYSGFEATADFYANYLKKFFGEGGSSGRPLPKMLEVINEPFVKVGSLGTTREEMSRYHNVVAKRVKELVPEIMVGGYSAAHPAFESGDFNHWRNNWKTFIDIAGENMDFFSFHLYDFAQNTSDKSLDKYRSGSNIEAIMDMINHYSFLKLGNTLPWSVSEYGWLCKECPGGYDRREDWYNLRSFNLMLMQLLERNHQIVNAIPFMLLKANWAKPAGAEYNTYGPRILREIGELPGEPAHGGWVYTDLLMFYQFWANVKGNRINTSTNDFDIMADAYIEGNKMFLLLSNHNPQKRLVNLEYFTPQKNSVKELFVKHLYAINDIAQLDSSILFSPIKQVEIGEQATMILEYTFANPIDLTETNNEKTYFADTYFQQIVSGATNYFVVRNIEKAEHGEAVLRLGLGRDHGKNVKPTVKVNNLEIEVPDDWRGDDQKSRDSFFGVLEIPVPWSAIKKDNTISVSFRDNGGYISSVLMQVFNYSTDIGKTESDKITGLQNNTNFNMNQPQIFPNPVTSKFQFTNINQKSKLKIFNTSGSLVYQNPNYFGEEKDFSAFENGIYIYTLNSEKTTTNGKFIKY